MNPPTMIDIARPILSAGIFWATLTVSHAGKPDDDWGPFAGPWKRYDKNPVIKLEGKETYSIQNGPQSVIKWQVVSR